MHTYIHICVYVCVFTYVNTHTLRCPPAHKHSDNKKKQEHF